MINGMLEPDALLEELDAALEYFGTTENDDPDSLVLLEQISTAVLMVEGVREIEDVEITSRQLQTVSSIVQNLHLFKIAETGSDLLGRTVSGVVAV